MSEAHWQSFLASPLDTIWMRGGQPMTAGESSSDPGLFPPTAWTWQGMIRTRMLTGAHGSRLAGRSQSLIEQEIGGPDALPAGWRIWGPLPAERLPAQQNEVGALRPWVPTPTCLAIDPRTGHLLSRSRALGPQAAHVRSSALNAHGGLNLMGHLRGISSANGGWSHAENLVFALLGEGTWDTEGWSSAEKRAQGGADLPPFVTDERRPGLTINASGTAEDHMLFFATHHRFQEGSGLWGAVEGAPDHLSRHLSTGMAHLGRKERVVGLEAGAPLDGFQRLLRAEAAFAAPVEQALHLRVVLLAPALRPLGGQVTPLPFPLPDGARLRGVEQRSGPDIGGFDRHGVNGSRASRATLGAGSSFWIELPAAAAADRAAHIRAVLGLAPFRPSDTPHPDLDAQRLGFGQRVGAPFDPATGLPGTGGSHAP
jgi:hypothetical protein